MFVCTIQVLCRLKRNMCSGGEVCIHCVEEGEGTLCAVVGKCIEVQRRIQGGGG